MISSLLQRDGTPTQVVIGTLRLERYRPDPANGRDILGFEIEATLFTDPPTYVTEGWALVRSDKAVSKPPTATRTWPCPNCGAVWQGNAERKCQHCGETMIIGRFDRTLNKNGLVGGSRTKVRHYTEYPCCARPRVAGR